MVSNHLKLRYSETLLTILLSLDWYFPMRPLLTLATLSLCCSVIAAPPNELLTPESKPLAPPFPIEYVDQGQFDPRLKGMLAPQGFRVEIVAESPTIINPVGMSFGPDGTLYVLEWAVDPITKDQWFPVDEIFHYQDGTTRRVTTMKKFVMDMIKQLKWDDETKQFGNVKPIIGEQLPSSILLHDGWLYTSGRGTVRRYKQSTPGGDWDIREVIAQGFCGFHHHQVSGLTIGHDGKLYITSGDNDNVVEGSDGSRATVMRTGAVFRCNPDGSEMETFSIGYRNPYRDITFNDHYNFFHVDNDNEDGSKFTGCRLMHVAEGVDYGWRLREGARCCQPDAVRGAVAGELPGKLPPMLKTGRGSPAGLLIYHDTFIPERYRGLLYYPDVYRKRIRAYSIEPDGSTFKVTHEMEFLKSEDPLFRPCQMILGPDGAMYVADWRTDSGGAGRLSGDGVHGRIYRISWVGTDTEPGIALRGFDAWSKLIQLGTPKLVLALNSPNLSDRVHARNELIVRGEFTRDEVLKQLQAGTLNADGKLAAMGVLQAFWSPNVATTVRKLTTDDDAALRRLAVNALGQHAKADDSRTNEILVQLLNDESPIVRREVILALGRIDSPSAADVLLSNWKNETSTDRFLLDAYVRALEKLGQAGVDAVLKLAQSGDATDTVLSVKAFTAFRTQSGWEALPAMLAQPHLTAEQQAKLIGSALNYQFDTPLTVEPLLNVIAALPTAKPIIRDALLQLFTASDSWPSADVGRFVDELLDSDDAQLRLNALRAIAIKPLPGVAEQLVGSINDPNKSIVERTAILDVLGAARLRSAIVPIRKLLQNKEEPSNLRATAMHALHAISPIKSLTVARTLLDESDPELLKQAVLALDDTPGGTRIIGERFVADKLPRELFPQVSAALSQHKDHDPALAKLHDQVMKGGLFQTLDPSQLSKIQSLVAIRGDALRGRELFLHSKLVNCSTCHSLEGTTGNVGPDLTRIWETHSLDQILQSIIEPSKEIKEGYGSYQLSTLDGRLITGLKVAETDEAVTLREATGQETRVVRTDIDELRPAPISLMPDDAVSQLNLGQFLDLLAFLKDRGVQESLRGRVNTMMLRWDAPHTDGAANLGEWTRMPVNAAGLLRIDAPKETKPVTLLCFVYSAEPQTIEVELTTSLPCRVQVGTTTLKPNNRVRIGKGWTPIRIDHSALSTNWTVALQLKGTNLRTSEWVEKAQEIAGND